MCFIDIGFMHTVCLLSAESLMLNLIFQQLTSKDKPHRQECRFPTLQSEYTFEEMREFAYTSP